MAPHARRSLLTFLVLASLIGALVPPHGAQSAQTHCDNPENGSQVASAIERPYDDLVVDVEQAQLKRTGGAVQTLPRVGAHYLPEATGTVTLTLLVSNQGHGSGGPTGKVIVRVSLAQPSGAGLVQNLEIDKPLRGQNTTTTVAFDLAQTGRHVLQLHVNPDRAVVEECDDGTNPNPECPAPNSGLPTPCHIEYYHNNMRALGLLVVDRPDLIVSQVVADGPVRATSGDHADSRITLRATIQNIGQVLAYDLASVQAAAHTIPVVITVKDCTCQPVIAQLKAVPAGGSEAVEATLPVHGIADGLQATVTIDPTSATQPRGVVYEASENNNADTENFPVPTPDLSVSVTTDLEVVDGRAIIAKGQPLSFTVNVQNTGPARAAQTNDAGFRIVATRDSATNTVLMERLTLDPHSTVSFRLDEEAANLTGTHEYNILVDDQKQVLESSESNNQYVFRVTVARFEAALSVTEAAAKPTVPPGVAGRVPFEVRNTGTVVDLYTLTVPAADQGRASYVDASGNPLRDLQLKAGETFKGELVYQVPPAAAKGDTFGTEVRVHSAGSGNTTSKAILFTVGDDTVPPAIALEDPATGYLSSNQVIIRVTDNVNVTRVETDVSGTFVSVPPDTEGGSLYTVDVTGRPTSFKLNVRATDSAGNTETQGFDLVRDTTRPRITQVSFTQDRGVVPGTKLTLLVEARDENIDTVKVTIKQPRPGGAYQENHTLLRTNINHQLRDWIVPERPGHYVFTIVATDKAGNSATQSVPLFVQGLDLRISPQFPRPLVTPAAPQEGEPVRITFRLENTSPLYATGPFFVHVVVDRAAFQNDAYSLGRQTVSLGPGESRPVTFVWPAVQGLTFFTLVIDEAEEVAEDNERNNLANLTSEVLFPGQSFFTASDDVDTGGTFVARLVRYWFMPVLFIASAVLFVIALALGRRAVPA